MMVFMSFTRRVSSTTCATSGLQTWSIEGQFQCVLFSGGARDNGSFE